MNKHIIEGNPRNRDLIVFGEDWGGLPSSTQQLIKHLAQTRKVIWVNSIGLRQPKLNTRDIKRLWHKITSMSISTPDQRPKDCDFVIANAKTWPAPRGLIMRWICAQLLSYQMRAVIKRSALAAPILWISLPTAVDIVGKLGESAVVYYCCDDFNALAGVDHQTVNLREQQLAKCADLILTSSDMLRVKFASRSPVTIEHGVDFTLFSTPAVRATDLPCNDQPTAGYYGSISSWLDLELLQQTIAQMPDWNFVLIGDITIDVSIMRQYSNVYFLASKAHELLPRYSQHWTASLLPFRQNRQIEACNPFKLREYLAAGRPIISTPFPALSRYRHLVDVVDTPAQMIAALRRAGNSCDIDPLMRQAVVNETWQIRAAQVARLVDSL